MTNNKNQRTVFIIIFKVLDLVLKNFDIKSISRPLLHQVLPHRQGNTTVSQATSESLDNGTHQIFTISPPLFDILNGEVNDVLEVVLKLKHRESSITLRQMRR
jgi:hypothetical protein